MDTKPRLGIRKQVRAKQEAGKCLLCADDAVRRGLCNKHYCRHRAAMFELPRNDRPAYEARAIRAGKLLPSRQGKHEHINEYRAMAGLEQ